MRGSRRNGFVVVSAVAVTVLIAGAVSASIPGPNGVISACIDRFGNVR
jgi:hypothetical protein